jgi:exodeoxyribonuclease V alpha subunit
VAITVSPIPGNDPGPPDPEATTIRCTAVGSAPRFISDDRTFAIWSAVRDRSELAELHKRQLAVAQSNGASRAEIEKLSRQIKRLKDQPLTIKGPLSRVSGGEMLICTGKWQKHHKYGWSFQVNDFTSALPQDASGIAAWLQTRVHGVGPAFAEAIVAHFGAENVYQILDDDPSKLREVRTEKGRALPKKQVEAAIEAWDDAKAIRQIETFLFSHGIAAGRAEVLYRKYGDQVVDVLTNNPYQITEIKGIGFLIADQIAQSTGVAVNDPERIKSGISYVLEQAESDGHIFLSLDQLVAASCQSLKIENVEEKVDPPEVIAAAEQLAAEQAIVVEPDEHLRQRIYLKPWWEVEKRVAAQVRSMIGGQHALLDDPKRPEAPQGTAPEDLEALQLPTDEQWGMIEMISTNRLCLLTGGPGVGKTACTNTLLQAAQQEGKEVLLCAPTGKAARRMREVTGHQAQTIHKLLKYRPEQGGFEHDQDDPLTGDLLIVDEASMLQLDLLEALLEAIPPNMHLLLVGDPDQLPPVGVGKAFDDLINSEIVPRVHLTKIFRQAAKSMIIQNSRRLNQGEMPYLRKEEAEEALGQEMLNDFFWVPRKDAESTLAMTVDMAVNRVPRSFGFDPISEVMVLAPMRGGKVGLHVLNAAMELKLNGVNGQYKEPIINKPPVTLSGQKIRTAISVGSRIVQTKNMYHPDEDKSVMNGEVGMVKDYRDIDKEALLSFDDGDREFWLPVSDMDSFHLAWALTIHRSQGSQWPCIVAPVSSSHYTMLSRNLEYVAVTRAEKLCVMVGESKALHMAIGKVELKKRNSTLINRILDPAESGELF